MITDIEIENFRGLESVKIENLKRINIIAGENNTGKTSVLEAVAIAGANDQDQFNKIANYFRTNDRDYNFWNWLFPSMNPNLGVTIKTFYTREYTSYSTEVRHKLHSIELSKTVLRRAENPALTPEESFNPSDIKKILTYAGFQGITSFARTDHLPNLTIISNQPTAPSIDTELISRVIVSIQGEEKLQEMLKIFDSRVKRVRYLKLPENIDPMIYIDVGDKKAIPLYNFGDGFIKFIKIYSHCLNGSTDILLIDEMTNGIHHNHLEKFWDVVFQICEQEDIQIITTTHSWESLTTAHKVNTARNKDEMAFYRLDRIPTGKIQCTSIPSDSINTALEMNWDLR